MTPDPTPHSNFVDQVHAALRMALQRSERIMATYQPVLLSLRVLGAPKCSYTAVILLSLS